MYIDLSLAVAVGLARLFSLPFPAFQRTVFRPTLVNEQALVSLKLKKTVDAEVGRTFGVRIEGG